MRRYFIYLAYNGEKYCGWQNQPNGTAVQEVLEKAISIPFRRPVAIVGAGRTDSGVHARMMVAHFDTEEALDTIFLTDKLNKILPKDIVVYHIMEVKPEAHARFDATSRLYRYYISTCKDPFLWPYKYRLIYEPDIEMMNKCANVLFQYQDFTSFSKLHTDVKTNNCTIMHAQWERNATDYVFTIKANRFLRNMVRSIVGTLLEAGKGKLSVDQMHAVIQAKDRGAAGTSVPGYALFLEEIDYNNDIFQIES